MCHLQHRLFNQPDHPPSISVTRKQLPQPAHHLSYLLTPLIILDLASSKASCAALRGLYPTLTQKTQTLDPGFRSSGGDDGYRPLEK
jgi:hypothetical protein